MRHNIYVVKSRIRIISKNLSRFVIDLQKDVKMKRKDRKNLQKNEKIKQRKRKNKQWKKCRGERRKRKY